MNKGTACLEKAIDVISGERRKDYGTPKDNFDNIARLWEPLIGRRLTALEVSWCMTQVKLARLMNTPDHADSIVDIAGYAGCMAEIAGEE